MFVPLVVPGLSSNSGTSSSSTSPSQDSSSTSSSPAKERSHEQAPGDRRDSTTSQNKNKKESNKHRLRDLPERFEEFTDILEDTEALVPAHVSQDSGSERPTKVVSNLRKHSIYTHFPKDRNCAVCLRTKMTRVLCRRRTGDAVLRATEFGDLITADHKVVNEGGESRNNHRYVVVVQDLATQWIQSYP